MAFRDEIKKFVNQAAPALLPLPTPELPDCDGQIFIGRVSEAALAAYWKDAAGDEPGGNERAAFVALAACDSAGSRIFQPEDVAWLAASALLTPMIERLYWAAREHNGLTEENRTAWRKNSAGTAGGGSPSCCAARSIPASDSTPTGS